MPIGIDVYVTVIGLLVWSVATIAWAVWKNRQEDEIIEDETTGLTEANL
jgi:hypothetical protein